MLVESLLRKELPNMKLITESTLFVLLLCCCCCCCCCCCVTGSDTCWVNCSESLTNLSKSECFLRDDGTSESCYVRISACENVTLLIDLTSKVQTLYIYNYIINLEIGAVRSHPEVTQLTIHLNYTYIYPDLFYLFPQLRYLDLYEVEFQFFPYFSDSNPLLESLSMNAFSNTNPANHSILRKGCVSGLSQLKTLLLFPDQFLNTTDDTFAGLTNLSNLQIYRFHVPNPVATFSPLVKLISLCYESSELADISFLSLTSSLFGLTYLKFHSNKITQIPTNVFLNYTNLTYIYLNYNEITTLEKDCFKGLSKLSYLNLDSNQLKDLSTTAFEGLDSLSWIDLSRNPICHLSSKTFEYHKQLCRLDLKDVPLCCDCDLQWMSKSNIPFYNPYCASPPQYVNKPATDPNIYIFCPPESAREGILTL